MTDKQSIHSLNTFVQPCFASFSPVWVCFFACPCSFYKSPNISISLKLSPNGRDLFADQKLIHKYINLKKKKESQFDRHFPICGVLIFYTCHEQTIRINLGMETHVQPSKWLWEKEVMDREHEKLKKRWGIKLYYFSYSLGTWVAAVLMVRSAAFRGAKW